MANFPQSSLPRIALFPGGFLFLNSGVPMHAFLNFEGGPLNPRAIKSFGAPGKGRPGGPHPPCPPPKRGVPVFPKALKLFWGVFFTRDAGQIGSGIRGRGYPPPHPPRGGVPLSPPLRRGAPPKGVRPPFGDAKPPHRKSGGGLGRHPSTRRPPPFPGPPKRGRGPPGRVLGPKGGTNPGLGARGPGTFNRGHGWERTFFPSVGTVPSPEYFFF